jgi:hypothetical protein
MDTHSVHAIYGKMENEGERSPRIFRVSLGANHRSSLPSDIEEFIEDTRYKYE